MDEQTEINTQQRIEELEEFAKVYYRAFIESKQNKDKLITCNDQFFLYAQANKLLGMPNGKKLWTKESESSE